MPVTTLYAAILALLFLLLSLRVIKVRKALKVEIGNGDDRELLRRIRVQANCAEYVPIGLILLALAESLHTSALLLHALGLTLLTGRILHAYGLSQNPHNMQMRVWGMLLTFAAIFGSAMLALTMAIPQVFT